MVKLDRVGTSALGASLSLHEVQSSLGKDAGPNRFELADPRTSQSMAGYCLVANQQLEEDPAFTLLFSRMLLTHSPASWPNCLDSARRMIRLGMHMAS